MSVHAPVGSFESTGLIHTLALLAVPLVLVLYACAAPAFRRHAARHRDQVRTHLYGPTDVVPSPAADPAAEAGTGDAPGDDPDDFDYDIYGTPSP